MGSMKWHEKCLKQMKSLTYFWRRLITQTSRFPYLKKYDAINNTNKRMYFGMKWLIL